MYFLAESRKFDQNLELVLNLSLIIYVYDINR